jgi:hypothetical protein
MEPLAMRTDHAGQPHRWFIGIGVGQYDDPTLNLAKSVGDVERMSTWFTRESQVEHEIGLKELAANPTWAQISSRLADFLGSCSQEDVVVVYIACHGEHEGGEAYLFGRDTPRNRVAGRAVLARQLGSMLGSSKPHNVLVIVDACIAGAIAAAIGDATRLAVREENTLDPYRRFAQVMIASTFGLDPALDGQFVDAFLRTVANERWTGSVRPWISLDQLIQGVNEELRESAPGQRVECTPWFNGEVQLIPNPNVGRRQRSALFVDEEFAAHFDPASRGVSRNEAGSFFTGRTDELVKVNAWLRAGQPKLRADRRKRSPMFVITGSPGAGKSALLSRIAVLCQPDLLPVDVNLERLPKGTVPLPNALDGVIWCHGKTRRQVVGELARLMDGTASSADALLSLAKTRGQGKTIAIDALDEAATGEAEAIAREVLAPLVQSSSIRLMVATRPHAIGGEGGDLLAGLVVPNRELLNLDLAPKRKNDMIRYVETRLMARGLAPRAQAIRDLSEAIAGAAGNSFLVASIAARSAQPMDTGYYRLPAEVGEALAGYLDQSPEPERIRDVLRPLAWTRGAGLPWGTVWPALATALAHDQDALPIDDSAIAAALDAAGDLVVESDDEGEPIYRLFHEALAENLRATTGRGIDASNAIATAMLELRSGRRWSDVPRHVRSYLPAFLITAGMQDELSVTLLDPAWARQRRIDTGDPLAALYDVEAANVLFARNRRLLDLAPLCHQYSRAMVQTLPPLIEVLALSGQQRRAEALATNLTDVADRMLAYRSLAMVNGSDGDLDAARRCAAEVERSVQSMHVDHGPMAWFWATHATVAAGLTARAQHCAARAIAAVAANDEWDRANGFFWAAMASRASNFEDGRAQVRAALGGIFDSPWSFRNQVLQAAAVSGRTDFLKVRVAEMISLRPGEHSPLRIGNLALALADAGLESEMKQLVGWVNGSPRGEPDSIKRWIWALALSGRHEAAVAALDHLHDRVERSKAIARVAGIIAKLGDQALRERLLGRIEAILPDSDARARARLIQAMWVLGRREEALAQAEAAIADSAKFGPMIDPRAESRNEPTGLRDQFGKKTARRAMVTSRAPMADEAQYYQAAAAAKGGNLVKASELAAKIEIPLFKARALGAIAECDPNSNAGLGAWMESMIFACRAGRGEVERLVPVGIQLLRNAGRGEEAAVLERRITDVDAAWQLELFVDEYASLRKSMASGDERTRILDRLMLAPIQLAKTRPWTRAEVRSAWERGEDGSRLFALGLMTGNPVLVIAELLVEGIRRSRSAFEQYYALRALEVSELHGGPTDALVRAVKDEVVGLPRGSSRLRLAQRIMEKTKTSHR